MRTRRGCLYKDRARKQRWKELIKCVPDSTSLINNQERAHELNKKNKKALNPVNHFPGNGRPFEMCISAKRYLSKFRSISIYDLKANKHYLKATELQFDFIWSLSLCKATFGLIIQAVCQCVAVLSSGAKAITPQYIWITAKLFL